MTHKGTLTINGHTIKGWWHQTGNTLTFTRKKHSKPLIRITESSN